MKPGWQTSEFWVTLIGQVLALLAITGAISIGDRDKLETALTNAVTAVFTLLTSAVIVIGYIRSRTALKSAAIPVPPSTAGSRTLPMIVLALAGGLWFAAPAAAAPPAQPTCFLCRPQRTDPAVLALLQQLAQNQQTMIGLLQQQQRPPQPPAPPIVLVPSPQQIPIGGPPRQDIPLGAAPKQDIPLGAAPKQDIPLGGAPKQEIPPGGPPRQEVPLGPPPRQITPPGEAKPAEMQRYRPALYRP